MYIHTWNYHYNQDATWVESKIPKLLILLSHPYRIPTLSSQGQQRFTEEGEQPPKRSRYRRDGTEKIRDLSVDVTQSNGSLHLSAYVIVSITMTKHNFFLFRKGPDSDHPFLSVDSMRS